MIQRLSLSAGSSPGAAGHWAPGPPAKRELPTTPRQTRAERELAEWLGRRAMFGAEPTAVGEVLLARGVPCEAWTATVAELSERQLTALVDEAGAQHQQPQSPPAPPAEALPPQTPDAADAPAGPPRAAAPDGAPPMLAPITTTDVTVTFGPGPLGLGLGENPAWVASSSSVGDARCFSAMVDRLNSSPDGCPGPAERTGVIRTTDLLSAVDGHSVATVPYAQIIGMIKVAPRPLMLSFRRAPAEAPADDARRDSAEIEEGIPDADAQEASPSPIAVAASSLPPAPANPARELVPPASLPQDIVHTVTQTAGWVAKHGTAFEQTIRRRNGGNPSFGFLFDEHSEAAAYYRACLAYASRPPSAESEPALAASPAAVKSPGRAELSMSSAERELFTRINAAHADISGRITDATTEIETTAVEETGKQVEAWAVLQELKLQEDVLQAIRTKAKTTGGKLDPGSSAMMEMTFSRVVRLTEQLADLELGQDASPSPVAARERQRRPKSAPPRRPGQGAPNGSYSYRATPEYAKSRSASRGRPATDRSASRGRPSARSARSRSRKRSGTPEMMRHPERRPQRSVTRRGAAAQGGPPARTRSKSVGHRRQSGPPRRGYGSETRMQQQQRSMHGRSLSAAGNGGNRSARSKSNGARRKPASDEWTVQSAADRLNDTLWSEYSEAPPFGASSERFWPQVLPSSRHRSQAFHRGGEEETPGPGSYSEHGAMGQKAATTGWRVGNDDLFAFLKAAAAEEHLPAFWREQFFRVRDLVDPELGVLVDEHDLATDLGVANSAARRKIWRQATAVLRASLKLKRQATGADTSQNARFGGHGSYSRPQGADGPGPGAYSPRSDNFRVPKRTNALYFTSNSTTSPRRVRSPALMGPTRGTPGRSMSQHSAR